MTDLMCFLISTIFFFFFHKNKFVIIKFIQVHSIKCHLEADLKSSIVGLVT